MALAQERSKKAGRLCKDVSLDLRALLQAIYSEAVQWSTNSFTRSKQAAEQANQRHAESCTPSPKMLYINTTAHCYAVKKRCSVLSRLQQHCISLKNAAVVLRQTCRLLWCSGDAREQAHAIIALQLQSSQA